MPRYPKRPERPYCGKHKRYHKWYGDEWGCPSCIAERIAEILGAGGRLREDI